jgi:hypothetical protein
MIDEPKQQHNFSGYSGAMAACIIGAVLGGCVSSILTRIGVEHMYGHKLYEDERNTVAPTIAKDPAFKGVDIGEDSEGGVWIVGYVPTTADKNRLKELVVRALGERRAERVTNVDVKDGQ